MKGDFTRLTFDRKKLYNSVRMQQGRVQLDADWNEQVDIQHHLERTQSTDVIGASGAPRREQGYTISDIYVGEGNDPDLLISSGRIYVDGVLCENYPDPGVEISYNKQPFYFPAALNSGLVTNDLYLVYLDVWERHITAIEDRQIKEVALGGPDTATRMQTVWQVKVKKHDVPDTNPVPSCWDVPSWDELLPEPQRTLKAKTVAADVSDKPCIVPAAAGYRRLENQLYRVEIHEKRPATEDSPELFTFKWSRDNGVVATRLLGINPNNDKILTVAEVGKDSVLSFAPGQWIEVTNETRVLHGEPGIIVQLVNVEGNNLTINQWPNDTPLDINDGHTNAATVRRWDHKGKGSEDLHNTGGALPIKQLGQEIELEDGVKVIFEAESLTSFRTGDYWLIPARVIGSDIEWPNKDGNPLPVPPLGIKHHYCQLALAKWDGDKFIDMHDCRPLFPALTEPDLYYMSGDGQETMPGKVLPQPLRVGVVNCNRPVHGAWVKFEIIEGAGTLVLDPADFAGYTITPIPETNGTKSYILPTNEDGEVKVNWQLEDLAAETDKPNQLVKATLLKDPDPAKADVLQNQFDVPVLFGASFGVAWQDRYGGSRFPVDLTAETVERALDQLRENVALYYVGGNGQEAAREKQLTQPLVVRVANGDWPFAGAKVRFKVVYEPGEGETEYAGNITPVDPALLADDSPNLPTEFIVITDDKGLAHCQWLPDSEIPNQRVIATLEPIVPSGPDTRPWPYLDDSVVMFNANLSIAAEVTYDGSDFPDKQHPELEVDNVESALDQIRENVTLYYVSGDGQEAMPNAKIPRPLQIRVANNGWPYARAFVRFKITSDSGGVISPAEGASAEVISETEFTVFTDKEGMAECNWQLGKEVHSQQVTATLEEISEHKLISVDTIRFNATTSTAEQVFYDPSSTLDRWADINDDNTIPAPGNVQTAIDNLVGNMESGDIGYTVPEKCPIPPAEGVPVFKDLLDVKGATNVKLLWNRLLCSLDAAKVPYTPNNTVKRWVDILDKRGEQGLPVTVQAAIDALVENLESSDIGYDGRNVKDVLDELMQLANNVAIPSGTVVSFAGSKPPGGWLECGGQAVNRTTFADLFNTIGTNYGAGDGQTTFNLPNLVGRVPIGSGIYSDPDGFTLTLGMGQKHGAARHSLTGGELASHSHNALTTTWGGVDNSGSQGWPRNEVHTGFRTTDRGRSHFLRAGAITNTGSNVPHNNLQPSLVVRYLIKI